MSPITGRCCTRMIRPARAPARWWMRRPRGGARRSHRSVGYPRVIRCHAEAAARCGQRTGQHWARAEAPVGARSAPGPLRKLSRRVRRRWERLSVGVRHGRRAPARSVLLVCHLVGRAGHRQARTGRRAAVDAARDARAARQRDHLDAVLRVGDGAGIELARSHGAEPQVWGEGGDLQWVPDPGFAAWLAPRLAADVVHAHMFGGWWAAARAAPAATPLVASGAQPVPLARLPPERRHARGASSR
jgi:hypothetical protein